MQRHLACNKATILPYQAVVNYPSWKTLHDLCHSIVTFSQAHWKCAQNIEYECFEIMAGPLAKHTNNPKLSV